VVQAQVLAFLSSPLASREASREARVREEQKERKIAEMIYSKGILNSVGDCKLDYKHWTLSRLYCSQGTRTAGEVIFKAFFL
jgi:hypothetical protein